MLLIKHDKSFHHLYVLIVLLLLMKPAPGFISGVKGATFGCIERERQALLKFKDGIIDDSGLLSTWGSEEEKRDCCKWRGVGCNNRTGHITHLDLHREDYNGNGYYIRYHHQFLRAVAMLSSLRELGISNNRLDGNVSESIGSLFQLEKLDVGGNSLQGPASFRCDIAMDILKVLDLSNNLLTGWIPDCLRGLVVLNLASNNISGKIPSSIGSMLDLQTLSLHNNSFVGELPLSLRSCSSLVFLDLSSNKLRGEIPGWIGESMPSLKILSLESNGFSGSIPPNLCHLSNIQILELSLNNISGIIPKCLNNLTSMVQNTESESFQSENDVLSSSYFVRRYVSYPIGRPYGSDYYREAIVRYIRYQNEMRVGLKGRADDYRSILGLLRIINFARNKLVGEIPEEITGLSLLRALNLSGNNLTGEIPQKIGQLKQLESLDLSGNKLSGVIPITMADLNYLDFLNLSNNHLSGRIPSSTQLQTFNASQFTGNLELCGQPLLQKCPGDETN